VGEGTGDVLHGRGGVGGHEDVDRRTHAAPQTQLELHESAPLATSWKDLPPTCTDQPSGTRAACPAGTSTTSPPGDTSCVPLREPRSATHRPSASWPNIAWVFDISRCGSSSRTRASTCSDRKSVV